MPPLDARDATEAALAEVRRAAYASAEPTLKRLNLRPPSSVAPSGDSTLRGSAGVERPLRSASGSIRASPRVSGGEATSAPQVTGALEPRAATGGEHPRAPQGAK
jgi:hypothetical protein